MKKLTKLAIVLAITSVLVSNLYATPQTKVWQKTYGGSKSDGANAITPTKDGGFIVAGNTGSNSNKDVYLIKIDKDGNKIWQKTYGENKLDTAYAITPTKDGGFIIAGNTESFGNGKADAYLIKIDKDGNKIWQKTYGGSDSDEANAITPTKDDSFIVAGSTWSFGNAREAYLIKIDKDGNKIWQKTYGGNKLDTAYAITPTKDGGFIVAGHTNSFGNGSWDVYLIKIDKDGNKIWQKTYGGSEWGAAIAITSTKDGGFIVAGYTGSILNTDVYLIKIDKNGNKVWQKTYGGSKRDVANAIAPTKDGSFIVAGNTESFGNGREAYLIKIDKDGNKIWQKTYGGSKRDVANAIAPTKDGSFIVAGNTESFGNGNDDVYLIKIDKDGNGIDTTSNIDKTNNKVWQKTYGGNKDDEVKAIIPTKDGGFIVAGDTRSFGNGKEDAYLIKIDKGGNKVWQKTYEKRSYVEAEAITPTKDGGFIVAGTTGFFDGNADAYLIKTDKDGNKVWQKTYGGSSYDAAYAIAPTKNGGFIVAGTTNSFSNDKKVYLIKTDKDGNKVWQKTYGGSKRDGASAITPTKDGGFIVAGYTYSFGDGKNDVYLIKIDKDGNEIWQKTYGGSDYDGADAITPTKDGGFIVVGTTYSFGDGKDDAYLIKINKNGNKVWQKIYGGSSYDGANAINPTKDGGFIVAGYTASFGNGKKDAYLIKIDKNGNKVWQKTFGGNKDDEAKAITPTKDGGFIVAGTTESFGNGETDAYLIKIDK